MWQLSVSWWELILRVVIIYVFLLVILRLSGKRQVGQLAPFDLVLLLVLSNSVQNAMNGGDNSVLAGLISAAALVLMNYVVGLATYKSKRIEALVEGRPEVLIHNGRLFADVMEREKLTHHAPSPCSERQPDCDLAAPVGSASQQQVSHVGTRHQKHDARHTHQQLQRKCVGVLHAAHGAACAGSEHQVTFADEALHILAAAELGNPELLRQQLPMNDIELGLRP